MYRRPFWIQKIEQAWKKRSIVWLSGVRRVGKTTITKMIEGAQYLNCDLPSVRRRLEDPEIFYQGLPAGSVVVLDEVHRLPEPSLLLKIAADEFPSLRILATGSSTLSATKKFRDSLTGRKTMIYLPPVQWIECGPDFPVVDLDFRLLHGGLPEQLLSQEKDPSFFPEWVDSFYARDILELFGIRNRTGFIRLFRLLLRQSGGQIEYTNLAALSEMSRPTVKSHIDAMAIAHAIFLLPPFHGGGRREITAMPKCYGFDTGFITYFKGWETIRPEDRGLLWEHLVLDVLRSLVEEGKLFFWKDKSGDEIDFVIRQSATAVATIECKTNPDKYKPRALTKFRKFYPEGANYVLCPHINAPFTKRNDGLLIHFCSLKDVPV